MAFEWDVDKARQNLQKHGVDFREAVSVFMDPLSETYPDPDHSADEDRFLTMGSSERGRLLVVAHTDRGQSVRIITARKATPPERKIYEEG